MNGANMSHTDPCSPQTSSYDYDAPLNEAGDPTPKFYKFRSVIEKHLPPGEKLPPVPAAAKTIAIQNIKLTAYAPLFKNLPAPVTADRPMCFEDLNQGYGFVLYHTVLKKPVSGLLKITQMRDYATIYLNGKRVAVLDRRLRQDSVEIQTTAPNTVLDILVENNGRINYGPFLNDNRQGITEGVWLDNTELTGWKMYRFPFTNTAGFRFVKGDGSSEMQPALYAGVFTLNKTGDTFLDMRGFGKGFVFLNGHNLGKYWHIGPQQTLYIPAPWLKKGVNHIVVFDELKNGRSSIGSLDHPILNDVEKE